MLIIMIVILVLCFPLVLIVAESLDTNFDDMEKVRFVIEKTTPEDYVYDTERYNFYRKDVNFLWWNQRYSAETLEIILPDYEYDIYESIERYKPKIISRF